MACKIYIFTFVVLNKLIKKRFGLGYVNINVPWAYIVHCKLLNDVVMHEYIYMIGCCLKDQGEEHFQFYCRNVSF
jgi:hypothetical protein